MSKSQVFLKNVEYLLLNKKRPKLKSREMLDNTTVSMDSKKVQL